MDPLLRAPPLAVRTLLGPEPPPFGCCPQGGDRHVLAHERNQRDQRIGSGHCRIDESIEIVEHSSGHDLAERSWVALIASLKRLEVLRPLSGEDERRWESTAHQKQVEDQPSGAAVSVDEGMDLFKGSVSCSHGLYETFRVADRLKRVHPIDHRRLDFSPGWWLHATGKSVEIVPAKASGTLPIVRVRVGGHPPYWPKRQFVDVANLGEGQHRSACPIARVQGVAVDPLGGCRIPGDLQVLGKLPIADCSPLGEQCLDLGDDQCVAFERGRMVGFEVPDGRPDRLSIIRSGQSPETLVEFFDGLGKALVDEATRRPTSV